MTRPPCFVVGELSLSDEKDSGNTPWDSCEAEARMEAMFTASFRLSALRNSTDFGKSVAAETERLLRGGERVCALRASFASGANICCRNAEVGGADGPNVVNNDGGGDGGLGGAQSFSNITFE